MKGYIITRSHLKSGSASFLQMNSKVSNCSILFVGMKMKYKGFRRKQVLLIKECYWIILIFIESFNCRGLISVHKLFFIVMFSLFKMDKDFLATMTLSSHYRNSVAANCVPTNSGFASQLYALLYYRSCAKVHLYRTCLWLKFTHASKDTASDSYLL